LVGFTSATQQAGSCCRLAVLSGPCFQEFSNNANLLTRSEIDLGGPTAAVVALHNPSIRVEVLDRDQRRLQRWNSPHLPIHEPGLTNVVRITRDGAYTSKRTDQQSTKSGGAYTNQPGPNRLSNLFFTSDTKHSISKADVVFLAVNTPTKTFGLGAGRATNMTALDSAVKDVAIFAKPGTIIVEKSTVPCGTAQRIRQMVSRP